MRQNSLFKKSRKKQQRDSLFYLRPGPRRLQQLWFPLVVGEVDADVVAAEEREKSLEYTKKEEI